MNVRQYWDRFYSPIMLLILINLRLLETRTTRETLHEWERVELTD